MWARTQLTENPRPIDLVMYRCGHLEDQVKRLQQDMEFMKTEFKKIMDEKKEQEKPVLVEKPENNSWWFY